MLGRIFWRERNKTAQIKMNGVFIIFYICLLYIRINNEGQSFFDALLSPVLVAFMLIIILMNILPFIYFYFYYFFYKNKQEDLGTEAKFVTNLKLSGSKILLFVESKKLHVDIWCLTEAEANELYSDILAKKRP